MFVSTIISQSSSGTLYAGSRLSESPALFTSMSIGANSEGNPATTDSIWSLSRTSRDTGKIRSPNSSLSAFSLSMRRAVATTRIPSFANRRAVAAPNPEDVPVTNATIHALFGASGDSASEFQPTQGNARTEDTEGTEVGEGCLGGLELTA